MFIIQERLHIVDNLGISCGWLTLALCAFAEEIYIVVIYIETCPLRKLLRAGFVAWGFFHVNNLSALGTGEVVMILQVAVKMAEAASETEFSHITPLPHYLEVSVNGAEAHMGDLLSHLFIYPLGCWMGIGAPQYLKDQLPLFCPSIGDSLFHLFLRLPHIDLIDIPVLF